jgi:hypothetical protein
MYNRHVWFKGIAINTPTEDGDAASKHIIDKFE